MNLGDETISTMFSAGAYSAFDGAGIGGREADALAKRVRFDEDDEDTWWSRNKGWVLPTAIGAGAFLIGADAGRNGRPDRNYFSNTGSLLWERVKALLGIPNSDLWRSMTKTPATAATAPAPANAAAATVPAATASTAASK